MNTPVSHQADGQFAQQVVAWQRVHGRHGLPWQATRDVYHVWLSEVMLQQTQVSTVLGYYERFLSRFPALGDLAAARMDDVLVLWSGLGYYSRARNLHRCAQVVMARYGGVFPADVAALEALPGIGPSTAAALAAFCFGQRVSIYDGNVKRVVARYMGFQGDVSLRDADRALLACAQSLLPGAAHAADMPAYTQGLMDLGATVCTRHQPRCEVCPLRHACVARATHQQTELPRKTRRLVRKTQTWSLLMLVRPDGAVWLQQRPAKGIWAGLYAFPTGSSVQAVRAAVGLKAGETVDALPSFVHALTHLDMVIEPFCAHVPQDWQPLPDEAEPPPVGVWVYPGAARSVGVPVPVSRLLADACATPAPPDLPAPPVQLPLLT